MKSIDSGKVKWTDKGYGKEFTTLDMWVLNPQWRSKDTYTLSLEARPSIIWSLVPGWTPLDPAGPAPNLQTSRLTIWPCRLSPNTKGHKAVRYVLYCPSQRCTVPVPGQTGFLSSLPMSLYVAQLSEPHSAFIYHVSLSDCTGSR